MAITQKSLKNNTKLSNNVSRMQNMFNGLRALVLDGPLEGLAEVAVKDFYHVVILETDAALTSVPIPDFIVLSDKTPYRNSVLFIDQFFNDINTIYALNYDMVRTYAKLKRPLSLFNINYLLANQGTSGINPAQVSFTDSGLDVTEPGVHLAQILGCADIQYTGTSANATKATLASITAFTTEVDAQQSFVPKNFISKARQPILTTSF